MWRPGEDCGSRFKVNLARGGLHHPKEPFLLHRWGQAAVAAPQGGQDSPPNHMPSARPQQARGSGSLLCSLKVLVSLAPSAPKGGPGEGTAWPRRGC